MRGLNRYEMHHTIGRYTRWVVGPLTIFRSMEPNRDVDPYGISFNQHDKANYPRTTMWAATFRSLRVEWSSRIRQGGQT